MAATTTPDVYPTEAAEDPPKLFGLLAEFSEPDSLLVAAAQVRDAGYKSWDCYTPFPVHGLDHAMGEKSTRLPWFVLVCGLTAGATAIFFERWFNAVDYRMIFSGKPYWSLPPNIPVAYEMTILFSALSAFYFMWAFNRLPMLRHPLLANERFRRVTDDGFFICIEARDPNFDLQKTAELLQSTGALAVEEVRD